MSWAFKVFQGLQEDLRSVTWEPNGLGGLSGAAGGVRGVPGSLWGSLGRFLRYFRMFMRIFSGFQRRYTSNFGSFRVSQVRSMGSVWVSQCVTQEYVIISGDFGGISGRLRRFSAAFRGLTEAFSRVSKILMYVQGVRRD